MRKSLHRLIERIPQLLTTQNGRLETPSVTLSGWEFDPSVVVIPQNPKRAEVVARYRTLERTVRWFVVADVSNMIYDHVTTANVAHVKPTSFPVLDILATPNIYDKSLMISFGIYRH